MLLQVVSHCMFIFIAVQDCVVWITVNFIYTFYCCWTFGWFPVFPVWMIWKGYSDHQICEIPCGFLFFLKNIYLCGARKKNLLLFESSSGILLRDQDLDWESEKPRAAVHALPRGSRLPSCLKMMGTFLPRDVWTNSFSILSTTLLMISMDQTAESLILVTIPHALKRMSLS